MRKLKVVTVGLENNALTNEEVFDVVSFNSVVPDNLSSKEAIFIINKLAKDADIVIVNMDNFNDTPNETIFLQLSYTNDTPIFGVGKIPEEKFVKALILESFDDSESVADHLKAIYLKVFGR